VAATPVRAVTCTPDDYICQQLQYDQGQQQPNANALAAIQGQIKDVEKQINDLYALITKLNNQLTAQRALIDGTQAQIDALDGKIRLTEADITRRQAHLQIRETLFDNRVRSIREARVDQLPGAGPRRRPASTSSSTA